MNDNPGIKAFIGILVRGALIAVGGVGINEAVSPSDIEAVAGVASMLVGIALLWFEKRKAARKLAEAKS